MVSYEYVYKQPDPMVPTNARAMMGGEGGGVEGIVGHEGERGRLIIAGSEDGEEAEEEEVGRWGGGCRDGCRLEIRDGMESAWKWGYGRVRESKTSGIPAQTR